MEPLHPCLRALHRLLGVSVEVSQKQAVPVSMLHVIVPPGLLVTCYVGLIGLRVVRCRIATRSGMAA